MKNITPMGTLALSLRRRVLRHRGVGEALSSYHPVGWCGGLQRSDGSQAFWCGGQATLGGMAVTKDTIFRVASVSKLFGAAAAMRLVARGQLSLDDPASDALGFSTGREITLRRLLTHTASLEDRRAYDAAIGEAELPPLGDVLEKSYAQTQPGTRFHYSNLGAGVAGMMVEAASGMLFDDFVRQEFFLPYGIDASFHPQRIVGKDRMANCYRVPGNTLAYDTQVIAVQPLDEVSDPQRHYSVPAGKLMISAQDLLDAFSRLYREDTAMFVRQDHIGSVFCDAGRGLGPAIMPRGVLSDRAYWGHQGTAYGALCEAWLDPADGTCAVLLMNGVNLRAFAPLYNAAHSGLAALLDHTARTGVY